MKSGDMDSVPCHLICYGVPHSLVCSATYEVERKLLHSYHRYRLLLNVVERVALELDLLEVDVHEVNAADVAVPCCSVIELHSLEVGCSSELCRAWETLRDVLLQVLAADRISKLFRMWKAC